MNVCITTNDYNISLQRNLLKAIIVLYQYLTKNPNIKKFLFSKFIIIATLVVRCMVILCVLFVISSGSTRSITNI